MLTSTPRASEILMSFEQRAGHWPARPRSSRARPVPAAFAEPIIAMPMLPHHRAHVLAKSTLIMPGQLMISADAGHCAVQHVVGGAESLVEGDRVLAEHLHRACRWGSRSANRHAAPSASMTFLRPGFCRLVPSKAERFGHHGHGQDAHFACAISATTGAAPVPVPPPMPAVRNSMSAPSRSTPAGDRARRSCKRGLAADPRDWHLRPDPLVMPVPSWIWVCAPDCA